jgi:endonuclease/exonuclease/phosphatase family metal-dependent hydrolase
MAAAATHATIRVITFNIHSKGINASNGVLAKIAGLIRESGADIVGLQEVDQCCWRSDGIHIPARLAELTKMEVFFGKTIDIRGGSYGNAILSRFPIQSVCNISLHEIAHEEATSAPARERRCALRAVIEVNGHELVFINTHLDHGKAENQRLNSVAKLHEMTLGPPGTTSKDESVQLNARCGIPAVIVGDFNATPESKTIRLVKQFMHDAFARAHELREQTERAARPQEVTTQQTRIQSHAQAASDDSNPITMPSGQKCIDYIFVSECIRPISVGTITTDTSDHVPVFAQLEVCFVGPHGHARASLQQA